MKRRPPLRSGLTLGLITLSGVALTGVALTGAPARAAITGSTRLGNAGTSTTAVADPTDEDRFFIAGRSGRVGLFDITTGGVGASPFLQIPGVSTSGEGGLLGLAFDPDYAANGYLYAYYTTSRGGNQLRSNVARFQRDPNNPTAALAGSLTPILSFDQPQNNHNGGWIGFSPNDGYLYVATGDGGGSDDTGTGHTSGSGNSQDVTDNLLGKMLRLDVGGDDFPTDADRNYAIPADNPFVGGRGDDEIWAYGLRNPFRNGFDRETGDLWIGDVGQNTREEIDFQPGDSTGGENYGWRLREGTVATPSGGVGGPLPADAVDPVYEYFHTNNGSADPLFTGNSLTGGLPYRGPDPSLQGDYFFADFASRKYWKFDPEDPAGSVENLNSVLFEETAASNPVSFMEDLKGNLYFLTIGGDVYRIDTSAPGDYDVDGDIDADDYDVWAAAYGQTTDLAADGNGNGAVDAADYTVWRDAFIAQGGSASVPEPSSVLLSIAAAAIVASLRRPPAA